MLSSGSFAQMTPPPAPGVDSVSVAPGAQYAAGGLHQFFFGNEYRALWKTPVRVPVLNLRTYAGGITATRIGGGKQTMSLRFESRDGREWVFRPVDKDNVAMSPRFEGTVVEDIMRDQISSAHPAGALVAAPLQEAAGVLHPTPVLVVMPDDPELGEFREAVAGRLGMMEEYPNVPEGRPGFAGAREIIDSEELLDRLNTDPGTRVDAARLLNARLVDMYLNDWDRHFGQWKWARMTGDRSGPWIPIARDRDKALVSYSGIIPALTRMAAANIVPFKGTYPSVRGLTFNSLDFDRRMLAGLEKPVWDSVVRALTARLSDSVIESAAAALPPEYRATAPSLIERLRQRRAGLPETANRFFALINTVVDLHATDQNDRATIRLSTDTVLVVLRGGPGQGHEHFRRHFVGPETREIRLYLHDGNDHAEITGSAERSITLRIIGGNGTNTTIDSATVGGRRGTVHLYDQGTVSGVRVETDTMFDRRPWIQERGELVPPGKDRGQKIAPILGLSIHGDYGIMPRFGISKYQYGFGKRPYARRVALAAQYSTKLDAWRIELLADQRREHSALFFLVLGGMSEMEVIRFHGLGNQSQGVTGDEFFDVDQRQWLGQTAIAWSLGPRSDIRVGPLVKYTVTNDVPNRFITADQPYGSGKFGEAGLGVSLHHDLRDQQRYPTRGVLVDLAANYYPALWDVESSFGSASASVAAYLRMPLPLRPTLAIRAAGKKLFGDFPYFESAFIGGGGSVRNLDAQRFAGDGSLAGTAELRVPLASFSFILPLDVGVFGLMDAGRVYLDGESPGGWHTAAGGGFWIGVLDPTSALSFAFTNNQERVGVFIRAGLAF
jgi:hypothetical protein